MHEQIRDQRGVQRTGTDRNQVCLGDRFEGLGHGGGDLRLETKLHDAVFARSDVRLSTDDGAIIHLGGQRHIGVGRRKDVSTGGQDLG